MKTKRLVVTNAFIALAIASGCSGGKATPSGGAGAGAGTFAGSGAAGTIAGDGTAGTTPQAGTGGPVAGDGSSGTMAMGGTGGGSGTGSMDDGGTMMSTDAGMGDAGPKGMGTCCPTGDCLCHGDPPSAVTAMKGPFKTGMYTVAGAGCVFYPTDATAPFAAVAVSDGLGGTGGCAPTAQTGEWGPLYASWGIVAMIIDTLAGDQPQQRGTKLTAAIAALKMENTKSGGMLSGKLSGRYGTSGFSMGGGGTTFSAAADPTLKTNVGIMAYGPSTAALMVPSLFIFGSSDGLANTMGMTSYNAIPNSVPKMTVTINSGHAGQPSSGAGASGQAGLAFQKVFLEGDTRWRPLLLSIKSVTPNIK